VRERQPAIARGQRQAGDGCGRAGADPVDHGAGDRCGDDREAGEGADDQAGDPEAEAARIVQVDHLERQDGAPAQVVQEDPDLDDPELAGQAKREPPRAQAIVTVQILHMN
jgi:hypothetical protein